MAHHLLIYHAVIGPYYILAISAGPLLFWWIFGRRFCEYSAVILANIRPPFWRIFGRRFWQILPLIFSILFGPIGVIICPLFGLFWWAFLLGYFVSYHLLWRCSFHLLWRCSCHLLWRCSFIYCGAVQYPLALFINCVILCIY